MLASVYVYYRRLSPLHPQLALLSYDGDVRRRRDDCSTGIVRHLPLTVPVQCSSVIELPVFSSRHSFGTYSAHCRIDLQCIAISMTAFSARSAACLSDLCAVFDR